MYYILHSGKMKGLLHAMVSHIIYDKHSSRELIATFNYHGLCISYRDIQRGRFCLAQYTLQQCNKVHVPLPSHILNKMITLAALDNFDHLDRPSPSCTVRSCDTVMTVFQIKPENKLHSKLH